MKAMITTSTWIIGGVILILLAGAGISLVCTRNSQASKVLTDNLSVPINGATAVAIDISTGSGNLTIDRLSSGEQVLVNGRLQYLENKGLPVRTVNTSGGKTTFKLRTGNKTQSGFQLPWEACDDESEWQIHLNPTIAAEIAAHSGGGNVKLDLAGMTLTQLMADTGAGNMNVILPDKAANLNVNVKSGAGNVSVELGFSMAGSNIVNAKSGAGNVTIKVPGGMAAKIHATTGMGKAIIDPQFNKLDNSTYASPNYDSATNKVEITVSSGAGNVIVNSK